MGSIDIDQLVRSILTDLVPVPPPQAAVLTTTPNTLPSEPSVFITSKVVSLTEIKEKLGSAKKLFILPKSILTPSAKDEIRKRKIEIAVKLGGNDSCKQTAAIKIFATENFSQLTQLGDIERYNSLVEIFDSVEKFLPNRSFLLTDKPATAMLETGKREKIRPVIGFEVKQTVEDIQEIGANLVVLSPKHLNKTKVLEIIKSVYA